MCSNYQPVTRSDRLLTFFGVERARDEPPVDVWPLGLAPSSDWPRTARATKSSTTACSGCCRTLQRSWPPGGERTTPDPKPLRSWQVFVSPRPTVGAASFRPRPSMNPTGNPAKPSAGSFDSRARCRWGSPAFTASGGTRTAVTCLPLPCLFQPVARNA